MRARLNTMEGEWSERRSGDAKRRSFDNRTPYERDRARIIHSPSFRRLQAKTQVLGIAEGDFHRTRLTHSMEVAQISGGLVKRLRRTHPPGNSAFPRLREYLPDTALTEAIAFSHDLGHPPFGHGGEIALNYMMREHGGFEGNGQSLRILTHLEAHTEGFGLDPTRRTLLGILKYPAEFGSVRRQQLPPPLADFRLLKGKDWKPPKCYMSSEADVVDWILEPFDTGDRELFTKVTTPANKRTHSKTIYKALDTSIMEIADDISYGVHDLEDGIALGLIGPDQWRKLIGSLSTAWAKRFRLGTVKSMGRELFKDSPATRKRIIGAIVNALITSVVVTEIPGFRHPLLAHNATLEQPAIIFLEALKNLTSTHIVKLQQVQTLEYKGRFVVMSLFEALSSDPRLLLNTAALLEYQQAADLEEKHRAICDYVAGMTDNYASKLYARLFIPGSGNVFERL